MGKRARVSEPFSIGLTWLFTCFTCAINNEHTLVGSTVDDLIQKLLVALLGGGPSAIIAVLLIIIIFLVLERRRLLKEIEKKDDKIDKIIDDYYKGNMTISEAFNSLKMVLFEIKSKL